MRKKNLYSFNAWLEQAHFDRAAAEKKPLRRSKENVDKLASWTQFEFYAELHGGYAAQIGNQYVAFFE